jgi:phosphoglycerate dehydrogenase-like enzyme
MAETAATGEPQSPTPIRLVLAGFLPPDAVDELRATDPRIEVVSVVGEDYTLYQSRPQLSAASDVGAARIRAVLASADILFTYPQAPVDLTQHTARLRWLQLLTAGADELPGITEMLQRVPVTTIREVRARPVAEYAMMLILAFAKRLDGSLALRRARAWDRLEGIELRGRTLGIVGLGSIGSETAQLARAFGMRLIATRRSVSRAVPDGVDELLPPERLVDLLRRSDFVVLTAPSTPATRHLIAEAELRAMQTHAILINVARGALVDERALVRALQEGWIAGAGLDVFEEEPLDPSSPLYDLDNVLMSCHSAGTTDQFAERVVPILCENLRRFLAGEPLRNQVDPVRGY